MKLGAVPYVLATTILELLALPFHLAIFFARRRVLRERVRALLEARRVSGRAT